MKILKRISKYFGWFCAGVMGVFFVGTLVLWCVKSPSNDRDWEFGQKILQKVEMQGENIVIKNLRDFDWTDIGNEERYKDLAFSITDIVSVEMAVSHFSVHSEIAHVFAIFNLKNGESVGLSIEARRDGGEWLSLFRSMMFDYEIIYVLATKEDLISLRRKRNEKTTVFPIKASSEKVQDLFLLVAEKVNQLYETPEFYHLIFKNCTNLIASKVEKISDENFPMYEKTFAPGHAGQALFEMGLIDTEIKNYKEVEKQFLIEF